MAITKLIRIKEKSHGDPGGGLKKALRYICNPEKAAVVGGNAGHDAEGAYFLMKQNKEFWHKTDGSQGFHYILSFPPDCGIDANTAARVAEDFTEELLNGKYYYMYSVHTDHEHMHAHIVFDSVSAEDGLKFHSPKGDWEKRIQPITDKICERYGLPALDYGDATIGVDFGEWKSRKKRESRQTAGPEAIRSPSRKTANTQSDPQWDAEDFYSHQPENREPYLSGWHDLIRDDIDEAILHSPTYSDFLKYMESLEYTVRDGKYLSLKPKGRERAIRTLRLGRGYGREEIRQRIEYVRTHSFDENSFRAYGEMETVRRLLFVKVKTYGRWHMTAFQRTFYRRWRNTCLIRRPDFLRRRGSRAEVMRLEELSENHQYLISEDIRTPDALKEKQFDLGNERKAVQSELSSISTQLYKSEVCRLLTERERLKSGGWLDADEEEKLGRIDEQITRIMPLDDALAYRDHLLEQRTECRSQMRDIKSKEKLFSNIGREFSDELNDRPSRRELEELSGRMKEEAERRTREMNRRKTREKKQAQELSHSREGNQKKEDSRTRERKTAGKETLK